VTLMFCVNLVLFLWKNHFVRPWSVPVLFVAAGFDFSLLRSGLYFCSVLFGLGSRIIVFRLARESW
jgi:hypothetical protein